LINATASRGVQPALDSDAYLCHDALKKECQAQLTEQGWPQAAVHVNSVLLSCCVGSIQAGVLNAFAYGVRDGPNLDLSFNALSGSLPVLASNMTAMLSNTTSAFKALRLASNSLMGAFPTSWATLVGKSSIFDGSNLALYWCLT